MHLLCKRRLNRFAKFKSPLAGWSFLKTWNGLVYPFLFILFLTFFFQGTVFQPQAWAVTDTRTWDGGGGDNNWSTVGNWSDDTVPDSDDIVVFDGTSTKDSTIDGSFAGTVEEVQVNSGYSGTLTFGRDLTLSDGPFSQAAGIVSVGSNTLDINAFLGAANFSLTGGTFNIAGALNIEENFTWTGGTFNGTSSTITFDGANTNENSLITCPGKNLNNDTSATIVMGKATATASVIIDNTGGVCTVTLGATTQSGGIEVKSGSTLTINGEVNIGGPMIVGGSLTVNTGPFKSGGGFISEQRGLIVTGTADLSNFSSELDVRGHLYVETGGTLTTASSSILIARDYRNSGTHTKSGQASNKITGTTLKFDGGAINGANSTVNCTGPNNDINVDSGATVEGIKSSGGNLLIVPSNCKVTATILNQNGGLQVNGEFVAQNNNSRAGGINTINGTFTPGSGSYTSGDFTVNNVGVANIDNSLDVNGHLTVNDGATVNMNGNAVSVARNFTVGPGATFNLSNKNVTIDDANSVTHHTFWNYTGNVGSLTINQRFNTNFKLLSNLNVLGNVTHTDGIVVNPDNPFTLFVGGNVNLNDNTAFGGANFTLELNQSGDKILTNNGGPIACNVVINKNSGIELGSDVDFDGDLTCTNGTLAPKGFDFDVAGNFAIESGCNFQLRGFETVTAPNLTLNSGSGIEYTGLDNGEPDTISVTGLTNDHTGLEINSTDGLDNFVLGSDLTADNLTLTKGVLDVTSNNYKLSVRKNLTKTSNGTLKPRSGTVEFIDPAKNSVITGDFDFYNLKSIVAKEIQFAANSTQKVHKNLTLNGPTLRSAVPGTPYKVKLLSDATQSISNVDVSDLNACLPGGQFIVATNSIDSGGNVCADFGGTAPDITADVDMTNSSNFSFDPAMAQLSGGILSLIGTDGLFPKEPYQRSLPVTNAGGALTDVAIRYEFKTPNTPADFFTKIEDCSALRFAVGSTTLSHWVELCDPFGEQIIVHMKIPSLATGSTNVDVYYGNPLAASTSDCSNVFPFCDDFSGNSLLADWTEVTLGGASAGTLSGGLWTKTCNGECDWWSSSALDAGAYISLPAGKKVEVVTRLVENTGPGNSHVGIMLYEGTTNGHMFGYFPGSNLYSMARTGLSLCTISTGTRPSVLMFRKLTTNGLGSNNDFEGLLSTDRGSTFTKCGSTFSAIRSKAGLFVKDWTTGETTATYDYLYTREKPDTEPAVSNPTTEVNPNNYPADVVVDVDQDFYANSIDNIVVSSASDDVSGFDMQMIRNENSEYYDGNNWVSAPTTTEAHRNSYDEFLNGLSKLSAGRYQLRLILRGDIGKSSVSGFKYLYRNNPPEEPTFSGENIDGSTATNETPAFTLTTSDLNTQEPLQYNLQIATDSGFSNLVVDYESSSAPQGTQTYTLGQAGTYTVGGNVTLLPDGDYYVRAKAKDTDQKESAFAKANDGKIAFVIDTATKGEDSGAEIQASAGADRIMKAGTSIILNASGSTGTAPLTYLWTVVGGGNFLTNPTSATPTFTAPDILNTKKYNVSVTVTDALANQDTDIISIHAIGPKVDTEIISDNPPAAEGILDKTSAVGRTHIIIEETGGEIHFDPAFGDNYYLTLTPETPDTPDVHLAVSFPDFDNKRGVIYQFGKISDIIGILEIVAPRAFSALERPSVSENKFLPAVRKIEFRGENKDEKVSEILGAQREGLLGNYLVAEQLLGNGEPQFAFAAPGAGQYGIIFIYNLDSELVGTVFGSAEQPIQSIISSNFTDEETNALVVGANNVRQNLNLRREEPLDEEDRTGFGFLIENLEGSINLDDEEDIFRIGDLSLSGLKTTVTSQQSYQSIASGDLNGDGIDDVVLVARDTAFIFFGPAGNGEELGTGEADVVILGGDPDEGFGSMAAVGDVTGNGIDDLVIGAPDAGSHGEGAMYVILGSDTWPETITLPDDANVIKIPGEEVNGHIGDDLLLFDSDGDDAAEIYTIIFDHEVYRINLAIEMAEESGTSGEFDFDLVGGCGLMENPGKSSKNFAILFILLILSFPYFFFISRSKN